MADRITLTTDFGTRQGSQSVLHGVIAQICPDAVVTDLTHEVDAFDVRQGGFLLETNAFWFPAGSVHMVVVDPGVGTERRPIAAEVGSHRFVGPDNGVLSWVFAHAEREAWDVRVVHLTEPRFWLGAVSSTFHGRDLFAPVAAHLACGVALDELGPAIDDPVRLAVPGARPDGRDVVVGEVIYIDPFGGTICSVRREDVEHLGGVYDVELSGAVTERTVETFGESDLGPDHLIALWDSSGYLLVTENNGIGGRVISPRAGDPVRVRARR
jgi:S-adenosylmethionine hydrolase